MSEVAKFKWDETRTAAAVDAYDEGKGATVEEIVDMLESRFGPFQKLTNRMVIGKLVSEGHYQKPEKPAPQPKDEGPTKAQILEGIRSVSPDMSDEVATGLKQASKAALLYVAEQVGVSVE